MPLYHGRFYQNLQYKRTGFLNFRHTLETGYINGGILVLEFSGLFELEAYPDILSKDNQNVLGKMKNEKSKDLIVDCFQELNIKTYA